MQLLLLTYLLGAVSTVVAAAFNPVNQRQATGDLASLATDCTPTATTTVTSFVTVPPSTITVADTSSLAVTSTSLSAELTGSNVVYVSVGESTTTFLSSYTAPSSVTIGVTTITLSPVASSAVSASVSSSEEVYPTATVQSTTYTTITTQVTSTTTIPSGFPLSTGGIFTGPNLSSGWNATSTPNTLVSALSGSGVGSYAVTVITTINVTTTTVEASSTGYPSVVPVQATTCSGDMGSGYGNGSGYTFPSGYGAQPVKRQPCTNTCSLVYAAFGTPAVLASWCNNYFGSTTINLPAESYCATETPYPVPTLSGNELVTPTVASSVPPATTPPPTSSAPVPNSPVPVPASPPSTAQTPVPPPPASTSQPAPASTSCGVSGPFVITFDNLPNYGPADNNTAEFPPIPDPYDLLWWSSGWAYVPPPTEPYPPQSGTHLAEFIPSMANNASQGSTDAGDVPNAAVGAGPQNYDSAYWFDVVSAWIGIDNGADDTSLTGDFVATAYKYDVPSGQDQVVHTQHFSPQLPCPHFEDCHLNQIFFDPEFTGLSAVSFYAVVEGQQRIFFIDTIQMSWWNNTCAAGLERVSQRKA